MYQIIFHRLRANYGAEVSTAMTATTFYEYFTSTKFHSAHNQSPNMAESVKDAVSAVADKVANTTLGSSSTADATTPQSQPNLQLDEESASEPLSALGFY